ncbi:MAG: DUF4913 domain-containing protein [Kocuria rhizophila]|uniref:DUF4913 domain-containing protein n=1 Tax=Kocuria carniphila TaxID=262208 RepID=UPI000DAFFE0D|nr:MAG: DUF4913 domain-containing protein [Kocuria rhizophila]
MSHSGDATYKDSGEQDKGPIEPDQKDFVEWVEVTVQNLESVTLDENMHWCSKWWDHPEAVDRLFALYMHQLACAPSSEDPFGAMSSWWVDHWDRHATTLFAKSGPFGECRRAHQKRDPIPTEYPPNEWFDRT